jgi:hypothetical protein
MSPFNKNPKSMSDEELRDAHRALWEYISKHPIPQYTPRHRKSRALFELGVHKENCPIDLCYACVLGKRRYFIVNHSKSYPDNHDIICSYCPCRWQDDSLCDTKHSLYDRWAGTTSRWKMAAYAMAIRDAWK